MHYLEHTGLMLEHLSGGASMKNKGGAKKEEEKRREEKKGRRGKKMLHRESYPGPFTR